MNASKPVDGSPAGDRRTRSRARRRNRLYAAAVELFIEQGFSDTTMEQIADRADFARATVFNYFPRKTAFLDEWTARRRARAAEALTSGDTQGWPLDRVLGRYMAEMALMSVESRTETRALLSATLRQTNFLAHPALADEFSELIRTSRHESDSDDETHVSRAGLIIATGYFAVLDQWISTEPAPFDLEQELNSLLDVVLHGIYTPAAPAK